MKRNSSLKSKKIISLDQSDFNLWNRFKAGDKEAFSLIYQRYVSVLFNYGLKIVNNRELIKDCIQDLFIELWRNRETIGTTSSIKYYLFKCIRRKIVSLISATKKEFDPESPQEDYKIEFVPSEEDQMIQSQETTQQKEVLSRALNQLSKRQKEAVYLKYYECLSNKEIANLMDLNDQSVYNLIHNSLTLLKKTLSVEVIVLLLCFFA